MKRVVIESPFAGDVELNIAYLRAAMRDCLLRGESPYASHGLYAQPGVLDDNVPEEREHGIQAGFAWRQAADYTVVYTDLGTSKGMEYGIKDAEERGVEVVYRTLSGYWAYVQYWRDQLKGEDHSETRQFLLQTVVGHKNLTPK